MNFVRKNKKFTISVILVCVGIVMLIVGILLMSLFSSKDNFGASYGGMMLLILGINFLFGPIWVFNIAKENEQKAGKILSNEMENVQKSGKEAVDVMRQSYQDIVGQFKSMNSKKNRGGKM